jgi:hypothetical protein
MVSAENQDVARMGRKSAVPSAARSHSHREAIGGLVDSCVGDNRVCE